MKYEQYGTTFNGLHHHAIPSEEECDLHSAGLLDWESFWLTDDFGNLIPADPFYYSHETEQIDTESINFLGGSITHLVIEGLMWWRPTIHDKSIVCDEDWNIYHINHKHGVAGGMTIELYQKSPWTDKHGDIQQPMEVFIKENRLRFISQHQ